MKASRVAQTVVGLTIAAVGLVIFFRNVDLDRLRHELAAIEPWILGLNLAMQILSLWLRGIRLHLLLPNSAAAHRRGLFSNAVIGFMLNNIFPARMGEAARVVLLWRQNRFRPLEGLGALIVERIWDIFVLAGFFTVSAFFLFPQLAALRSIAFFFAMGCLGWLGLLVAHAAFPRALANILAALTGKLPPGPRHRTNRMIGELLSSLGWVRAPMKFAAIIPLSIAVEMCYAVAIAALLGGREALHNVSKAVFVLSMGSLGAAIPLAPGYVGTLHAFLLQGMTMIGVADDRARAIAIVFHACGYLTVTVLGVALMLRLRVSLGEMSKAKIDIQELKPSDTSQKEVP